jgi:peptidoglycan/xylan/chitin deacetylase (PgdA/CDA1 family)
MGLMLRLMLLVSAAGKVVAVLLWAQGDWPWVTAAVFFIPDFFILYHVFVPSAQGVCRVFTRFVTTGQEVWLTIDDGPDADDTPRILDLLDQHRARATFFVIGERAARQPQLVAEIIRRGHQVGHHTQTHPAGTFWCAGPARTRAELDGGLATLRQAGAPPPRWFRAPVGIKNLFLAGALAARGLRCAGWTVRSRDTMSRDPVAVAARVMRNVQPGAIILMHEGPTLDRRVRVRAIALVLEALAARGLACVTPGGEQLR